MIKIQIIADERGVMDSLKSEKCTLEETSVALFRLKQIEKQLIEKEFESIVEVKEE